MAEQWQEWINKTGRFLYYHRYVDVSKSTQNKWNEFIVSDAARPPGHCKNKALSGQSALNWRIKNKSGNLCEILRYGKIQAGDTTSCLGLRWSCSYFKKSSKNTPAVEKNKQKKPGLWTYDSTGVVQNSRIRVKNILGSLTLLVSVYTPLQSKLSGIRLIRFSYSSFCVALLLQTIIKWLHLKQSAYTQLVHALSVK